MYENLILFSSHIHAHKLYKQPFTKSYQENEKLE